MHSNHEQPALSQQAALAIAISYATAYVAPFYLVPSLRVNAVTSRNSPASIRARSHAVTLACSLCFLLHLATLYRLGLPLRSVLHQIGFYPISPLDTVRTLVLLSVLFAAPLYERGVVDSGLWTSWFRASSVKAEVWHDWEGWRNLVVGPVSEELVFRALNSSLFISSATPANRIVRLAPLLFGIAHLHHLNEYILVHKGPRRTYLASLVTPRILIPGLLRTLFQFAFTSVFGAFVTFVHLRTANFLSCVLAHTFCNWMGLPRVWGRVGRELGEGMSEFVDGDSDHDQGQGSGGHGNSVPSKRAVRGHNVTSRLGLQWTIVYYLLLFGGAYGFKQLMWPLTESRHALVEL